MSSPEVSVCIPTYNGREHLEECLASIRAQRFADFEVVLCDDDSADGTLVLARQLVQGDERFRLIRNPRRHGLVGNWNHCVRQARGRWIKFVFQDDTIDPGCLEQLLAACRKSGRGFGFCERDFIFEEGIADSTRDWFLEHRRRLACDYQSQPVIAPAEAARAVAREPLHNLAGEPTVTLINRGLFDELGGFDEALIQVADAEFWCRVMINHGAVYVPDRLATFRVHRKATTALNHGKRGYRTRTLDPLVLRYLFGFQHHFKRLRDPLHSGSSVWSVRKECAVGAFAAWRQARRAMADGDDTLMEDWRHVRSCHPGIQMLAWIGAGIRVFGFGKANN